MQRKIDKYSELRQQQQVMLNKEEDIREELKTCKLELETTKVSNVALQRDKLKLMEELRGVSISMKLKLLGSDGSQSLQGYAMNLVKIELSFANVHNSLVARRATEKTNSELNTGNHQVEKLVKS